MSDLTRAIPSAPAPKRGHYAKIAEAVHALRRAGRLVPNLRPVVRDRRVIEWLKEHGYVGDLPSPSALTRFFSTGSERIGKNG